VKAGDSLKRDAFSTITWPIPIARPCPCCRERIYSAEEAAHALTQEEICVSLSTAASAV